MLLSAAMGMIVAIQLIPAVRRHWPRLHRRLGYLYTLAFIPFMAEQVYTMFMVGSVDMGSAAHTMHMAGLVVLGITTPMGIVLARLKRVPAHRICMTLSAAALFTDPVSRLAWVLLSKVGRGVVDIGW